MNSERVEVSLFEESEVDKDNSDVSSTPILELSSFVLD